MKQFTFSSLSGVQGCLFISYYTHLTRIKPSEDGKVLRIIPNGQSFLAVCLFLTKATSPSQNNRSFFQVHAISSTVEVSINTLLSSGAKTSQSGLVLVSTPSEKVFTIKHFCDRGYLLGLAVMATMAKGFLHLW